MDANASQHHRDTHDRRPGKRLLLGILTAVAISIVAGGEPAIARTTNNHSPAARSATAATKKLPTKKAVAKKKAAAEKRAAAKRTAAKKKAAATRSATKRAAAKKAAARKAAAKKSPKRTAAAKKAAAKKPAVKRPSQQQSATRTAPATHLTGHITYVATAGKDTNPGSAGAPVRSIQRAVNVAPANSTVAVSSGTYAPFTVARAGVTVTGAPGAKVTVQGNAARADVVLLKASSVTLQDVTVAGCVPDATPPGSYENNGSSGVRINDGTSGVVVNRVTIRDSHGRSSVGPIGCYGVFVHNATNATVSNSNIFHNGYGVFVFGAGNRVKVQNNNIHDNDVIIRNDPSRPSDDFGGVGIGFTNTRSGSATGNTVVRNAGPSHDWGTDGGGFEIYQSSNVSIRSNTVLDNENIMETGAGKSGDCVNNTFSNNTTGGRGSARGAKPTPGLLLRCAHNMTVSGNTMKAVDSWQFWIYQPASSSGFGGSVSGLTITGNHVTQNYDKLYAITSNPSDMNLRIQANHYAYKANFASGLQNSSMTLTMWRSITGYDQ